jgi:signal transduction histidine kinase
VSVPIIPDLLRAKVRVFAELTRKTSEAEHLARDLERRVAERTAELEAAIARQTELADRLREADRRKDEFLAQLAHELRNPLASLHNAVSVLRMRSLPDEELEWCRGVMTRQTEQLTRLVEDLLDVSRITLGKIRLQHEPIDLRDTVTAAVETIRPLIDQRRHDVRLSLPDEPVIVEGDDARLNQVVANLLHNAAKYQAENGWIELEVTRVGEEAMICVRDGGFGIPPELLPRIFESFSQGDHRSSRLQGGLGLGLALVQRLVEKHGGEVMARSEGPGRGSEFIVRLPTAAAQRIEGPPVAVAPNGPAPRRILVVDDSADAAESLALLLRMKGHEVSVAYDGPRAVELAESERPAVMLLDIGLPGMDGYEVCRRVRERGLETYIVAMTGYGQDKDRERSLEAGFDGHAVKPVGMEELMRVIAGR